LVKEGERKKHEYKEKKGIVLSLPMIIALVLLLTTTQSVLAGSGYQAGYSNARATFIAGGSFNDHCGFQHSELYCFDYKLGYRVGWTATEGAH
jgi:hypothetical protein